MDYETKLLKRANNIAEFSELKIFTKTRVAYHLDVLVFRCWHLACAAQLD
jgi:hypothetical protein